MLWSCWCLYIVWNNVFVHGTMCFKHILVWGVWKELCRPQCLFQENSWQLLLWALLCMLMISFGIKCNLSKKFETMDLGEIHYCLGIQVNCIWQDQTIYIYIYIYITKLSDHIEGIYMHFGMIEKEWIKIPFTYQL